MRLLLTTQILDKNDPILGFFHRWVEEFTKHFERVDVICLKEGEHSLPDHVHVHSLGKEAGESRMKYTINFYRFFWRFYMGQRVDFVFFHMGAVYNILAVPFFLIRKLKKTKFYWWKTYGHVSMTERIALLFVDRVYTAVAESFPVNTKKRQVIGHAIDAELFTPKEKSMQSKTLLFVGRVMPVKRIEDALMVVSVLKKRGKEVPLRVVGAQSDNAYVEKLKAICKKERIEELVTFVGPLTQEALVSEYQNAAVCINPSDTDGLDKVVLEGMAAGVPTVTANRSFKTMLQSYGLYVEKGDIDAYAEAVLRELNKSDEARRLERGALRTIILNEHAIETLPKRIFNI